jgi:hypothetical protein
MMSWTPTSNDIPHPPPSGLCDSNMALLGNDAVLLSGGGCSSQGDTTNTASLYDPVILNGGNALAFAGCSGGCTENNN